MDASGAELARFGVTGHGSREMSWTVLRVVEEGLAPLLGEKWTAAKRWRRYPGRKFPRP